MNPSVVLADVPGAWVDFESRGRQYRARMDPMWLGCDDLQRFFDRLSLVYRLFDQKSSMRAVSADVTGRHLIVTVTDYLDAVGIGWDGLAQIIHGLKHIGELELDLLKMRLDAREWLDPEGSLSSRRMALLIADLRTRPESSLGALNYGLVPISKEGIMLARIEAGLAEAADTPYFLKSSDQIRKEREQAAIDAEKRERIKAQTLTSLQEILPSADSFSAAREESLRQLEKIMAAKG